jgi:hypothetical protein
MAPAELKKREADAATAATKAKFAESEALAGLNLTNAQINNYAVNQDIAKQNARIAAARLALDRESNDLKRKELSVKLDEMVRERDEKVRAAGNIDNMVMTLDRILDTPEDTIRAATGTFDASWASPTFLQSTKDFEALVENLDAQTFISQIGALKGMGALSDAEGKKLGAALQNFSLKQSKGQFINNVKTAKDLMDKAKKNLQYKYGVGQTQKTNATGGQSFTVDY